MTGRTEEEGGDHFLCSGLRDFVSFWDRPVLETFFSINCAGIKT